MQEVNVEEESNVTEDNVYQKNSTEDNVYQKNSTEDFVYESNSAGDNGDKKSSPEDYVYESNSAKDNDDKKSSPEDYVYQSRSKEDSADQKRSTEDFVYETSSTEEVVDLQGLEEHNVDDDLIRGVNNLTRFDHNHKTPATFNWHSGIVPFVIAQDYDAIISQRIQIAMLTIESSSCVVFKNIQQKPQPGLHSAFTWLSIENPEGVRECSHTTMHGEGFGRVTKAVLVIGYDCMTRWDILHALLHALGFRDEVTHPQRDQYIRVMWANIQPKYRSLFWMRMGDTPHKMVEYDSMSVMHFHDRAFSVNGGATIMPLVPGLLISPSDSLSQIDVMKLRLAFGHECNKRKVGNLLQTCQNAFEDDEQADTNCPIDRPTEEPADQGEDEEIIDSQYTDDN